MKFVHFEVMPAGEVGNFRLFALTDTGEMYTVLYTPHGQEGDFKKMRTEDTKPKSSWRQ